MCGRRPQAILVSWDIKHENFGWMSCWGDLVWLLFTYTIQAQYLMQRTDDLPWWGAIGIVVLNVTGYIIFLAPITRSTYFVPTTAGGFPRLLLMMKALIELRSPRASNGGY
jgi:hypothetical protein